jgi:hypothetical protein
MYSFSQTCPARSDMSSEYWTSRMDSRELARVAGQTFPALVGQVRLGQTCSTNIGQVGSDMSCLGRTCLTACFLIKLQNYLEGFSKA